MPSTTEIATWLYSKEYDALDQAFKRIGAGSIEKATQNALYSWYHQFVSAEQQKQIEIELHEQLVAEQKAREEVKRYSAICITEGGLSHYFETETFTCMRSNAQILRQYLRNEMRNSMETLSQSYGNNCAVEINAVTFQHDLEAFGISKNVVGVFDIDIDAGTFTSWDHETGHPSTYALKDVSTAVFHAMRNSRRNFWEKDCIFKENLIGKELHEPDLVGQTNDIKQEM